MNTLIVFLIGILVIWMCVCMWCGFRKSFGLFTAALIVGLFLNMAWMMIGLDARILEPHALMAQGAVTLYGISAFGLGWLAGRISRVWRLTKVNNIGA